MDLFFCVNDLKMKNTHCSVRRLLLLESGLISCDHQTGMFGRRQISSGDSCAPDSEDKKEKMLPFSNSTYKSFYDR